MIEMCGVDVEANHPDDWIRPPRGSAGTQGVTNLGDEFSGRIRYWNLGRLHFADIQGTAGTLTRQPSCMAGSNVPGCFWLSALVAGGVTERSARGDVMSFRPGDVAVTKTMLATSLTISSPGFHWISLLVPRSLLSLPAELICTSEGVSRRLERGSGLVETFHAAVETLSRSIDSLSRAEAMRALVPVAGLAEVMVSVGFGSGMKDGKHDRRSRLEAIKDYIKQNLADPNLDVGAIARAHHVSIRCVHSLFADNGERAATWIRQRRIEHACRDLLDPRLARLSIGAIATRNGFTTASHFGQLFRDKLGVTPAAYRNAARDREFSTPMSLGQAS